MCVVKLSGYKKKMVEDIYFTQSIVKVDSLPLLFSFFGRM